MKKCLFALAALSLLFACTPEESDADDSQSGNGGDKIVHVTGISLDITYATIKEGEQLVLVATITPDNAENKTIMWSSSSDAIASVDNSGKVTGIKAGSATITATTEDGGMKASCTLSVEVNLAPVITIGADHVSATSAVLYGKANLGSTVADDLQVGFQYSKSSGILPSNSTTVEGDDADSNYNYSSTITGLEPATTYYFRSFVRQNGQYTYGETKSFTTTVILVESISLDKSSLSLGIGNEATISITSILPDNANDKTVTWSSSNSAVASVDNNGKVTAKAKGNATIKATANDGSGVFASCAVVVDNIAVPQAVDMGTVVEGKNVKWATFNIGASEPEDYGEYYAWGETAPKTNYSWANYKFGASNTLTKYNTNSSNGALDNRITLELSKDDVAHVKLGGNWRMPTDAEWTALRTKCTWSWTTRNGVNGMLVRATNGNSIFLPAAGFWEDTGLYNAGTHGYYWSSSLNVIAPYNSWYIYFLSDGRYEYKANRYYGFSIRPVEAPWVVPQSVSLDKTSIAFAIGNTWTLKATVLPADANDKSLSWTSSDTSVATVDNSGKVTAKAKGKTTIKATANDGSGVSAECSVFVIEPFTGFGAVDLGLSIKWANTNIGASKPEDYGDYYAWGETETKSDYSWSTYKWCNGSHSTLTKYNTNSSYGNVDYKTVLESSDDVASVKLGDKWRMPTDAEWTELMTKCTWTWTTLNGVNGSLVTATNGNSIFLPAAGSRYSMYFAGVGSGGYYWSSSLTTDYYPYRAWCVLFYSDNVSRDRYDRYHGQSVRPVYYIPIRVIEVNLSASSLLLYSGEEQQLIATVNPSDASYKFLNWTSSDTSVATVDNSGKVTAKAKGKTTIKATANDGSGVFATCSVAVREPYTAASGEAVDLGLSVKWSSTNLGARSPSDYGDYFAWGETAPNVGYSWSYYELSIRTSNTLTKYNNSSSYGTVDNKSELKDYGYEDDAASQALGGKWRIPTDAEWTELKEQCTWTWTKDYKGTGVKGEIVTAPNGNSIFLPAAGVRIGANLNYAGSYGRYWSSSVDTNLPNNAWYVFFYSGGIRREEAERCVGHSVRPVYYGSYDDIYIPGTNEGTEEENWN